MSLADCQTILNYRCFVNTDLYWMREAELKHARIAMLAVVGSVAQEAGFVVPGLVSCF